MPRTITTYLWMMNVGFFSITVVPTQKTQTQKVHMVTKKVAQGA